MFHLSPPRHGRCTKAALLALLLLASLTSPVLSQTIPPGFTQVDCMVLPDDVVYGDSVFTATSWPGGSVYIQFDASISATRRDEFRKAMAEIEAISGVRFFEVVFPLGFIRVIPNSNSNNVSYSSVGWQGVIQDLAVGANHWDDKYILVHELFHALGYLHEQSRIDRDQYVSINFNNISTTACNGGSCAHNFNLNLGAIPVGPYDFQSIMHYGQFAFAINNNIPTITAKPGYTQFQNQMGNRQFMTARDAQGIAQRYGGPSQPTVSSISPTTVVAGSAGFWLTVNGTRFFEGSFTNDGVQGTKVVWNGTLLETEWISKTQVRAWISSDKLASAGTRQVQVENDVLAGYRPPASQTFTITTPPCGTSNDRIGHAVKGVGDVTGDGVPDYVVGAPGHGNNAGRVYMYSGATNNVVWTHTGSSGQQLGWAIAVFEDITGDGRKDLLVGMPGANNSGGWKILNGANGATLASYTYALGISGFGQAVEVIGDIDNDGDQEFIVGAEAYNNIQGRVEIWSVNGGLIRAHNGPAGTSRFGASVGGGYDVNNDGVPDYVVGSPWFPGAAGASSGRISIYSGATGALLASREGDGANDYLGTSCAIVPGVDGGAPGSIVAGATDYGNLFGNNGGTGYVRVYRASSNLPGFSYATRYTIYGTANGDRFGTHVSDAGDVNDDGRTDLLIGAVQGGIGGTGSTGTGYVQIHSGVDGSLLHKERRIYLLGGAPTGLNYGYTAALIGDKDNDGHLDYIVGVPFSDTPCTNAGDFDQFSAPIPPALGRVLITEVNAGNLDGVELCNFGTTSVNLSSWRLRWKDGAFNYISQPLGITLAAGEIVVITEPGAAPAEKPAHIRHLQLFPSIGTTTGDCAVALINGAGRVVDEVRLESTSGAYTEGSLGGKFRGIVRSGQDGPIFTGLSAERAWGLDSNSGGDWYGGGNRSFGLENLLGGTRGTDTVPMAKVKLNEIDDSPDFLELRNTATSGNTDMRNWYILTSAVQNNAHVHVTPNFTSGLLFGLMPNQTYVVLGDTNTVPAEKPSNVPYINVASTGPGFPWITAEFDCALYDNRGRLADYVRTARQGTNVVHNHPRAPSAINDFRGFAPRNTTGDRATGRSSNSFDFNRGTDWRALSTRTMGSANSLTFVPVSGFQTPPPVDVRLNSGGGGAVHILVHGGPDHGGEIWTYAATLGHLYGTGPLLGLGPDAINNYILLTSTPGFSGLLNNDGVARSDFPINFLPPGVDLDQIFFLNNNQGQITSQSGILMFDTF